MNFFKKKLLMRSMKIIGTLILFLSPIFITPTCTLGYHQPKCPDELLK
ncbi:cyclic lactone autoinducer peptide [Clostridium sp. BJN0013]